MHKVANALIVLAIFIGIAGCSPETSSNRVGNDSQLLFEHTPDSSVPAKTAASLRDTVEMFASKRFEGRFIGMKGNEKTGEALVSIFSEMGLEMLPLNSYKETFSNSAIQSAEQVSGRDGSTTDAYNVIGKIPGRSGKSALVLSAHFDHLGKKGEEIFYGAVDNSSGLAILLDLANRLSSPSVKDKLDRDVLICAFNGEEVGLLGSRAFAGYIKDVYGDIRDINIECISGKSNKLIVIGDMQKSGQLIDGLSNYCNRNGFVCEAVGDTLGSDHKAFTYDNMFSLTIGQEPDGELHTTRDTADKLDYKFMAKVSDCLYGYIISDYCK